MIQSEFCSASSDVSPHAVMPWPPRMQPIACGFCCLDRGDVEAELEAGAPPRHPHDLLAEDLRRELLAVGGGRDRDARVGVQVVDVRGIDEAVHRGVDRRRGAALAVQAVVERGDHLVFALDAGVDVHEGAHAVEAQHREARLLQRAEVAARALDPQQLDGLAGDRVGLGALRRRVAAGVVRVLRVGAEAVGLRAISVGGCAGWSWLDVLLSGVRLSGRASASRRREPVGSGSARRATAE